MKNFIFKSSADDSRLIKNVFNKLDMLLAEQRKQRADLSSLLSMTQMIINSTNLQKQVDEYFDKDEEDSFKETSPQTDRIEQ